MISVKQPFQVANAKMIENFIEEELYSNFFEATKDETSNHLDPYIELVAKEAIRRNDKALI
jgi:hypothetical protein